MTRIHELERRVSISYVIDPVGLPDFAQWGAGGRVIPVYTTLKTRDASTKEWRGPEIAITPVLGLGDCWPIQGRHGSLGISLARTIQPRSFSVEHAPRKLAFDLSSAPRDIEVWTIPKHSTIGHGVKSRKGTYTLPKDALKLAGFSYDIHASAHVQTFDVFPHIAQSDIHIGFVVIKILDNWGNLDFTCLYRIRVHGYISN